MSRASRAAWRRDRYRRRSCDRRVACDACRRAAIRHRVVGNRCYPPSRIGCRCWHHSDPVELAAAQAAQVALQAGQVDAIVVDWLWVARQRAAGADWTFVPFSEAVGALIAPDDSPIRDVPDLAGRALGSPAVRSTRAGLSSGLMRASDTAST